jgi:hypothetical protein
MRIAHIAWALALAAGIAAFGVEGQPADTRKPPERVIFVGNSLTRYNDLPGLVREIARSVDPRDRLETRQITVDGAYLAVQRGPGDGTLTLTVAPRGGKRDGAGVTLVEIEPPSFVKAAARFARALADKFVELDKSQAKNLRLVALQRAAHELDSAIADATADDSLTNPEPESYRSFGLPRTRAERGPWEHGGKMRFLPRWVATVPGIDLRATFHCGERIVVGSARETACLESTSGQVLWRLAGPRAACVATPLGVARVHQDGLLELIDLERGEARFSTRLRPRSTIGAAGVLVNATGLPRREVLAEGDR